MVREIDVNGFAAALAAGAPVIDVRDGDEYVTGHVPGAELIPLGTLQARVHEVPRNGPVYVICASGGRSAAAAQFLTSAGVDAISVAGGTSAWAGTGHPVVRGPRANAA
jgi:rhodanese-related sulfurtransferase